MLVPRGNWLSKRLIQGCSLSDQGCSRIYCCLENRLNRNNSLKEMKMFTIPRPLTAPRTYELSHKSRVIGIQLAKKLLSQYSDHGKTSSTTPTSRQNTMNS